MALISTNVWMGHTRRVTESEVTIRRLNLGPADDEDTLSFPQNKKTVEKILMIVANYSCADAAKSFILTDRMVFNFKRKPNKEY